MANPHPQPWRILLCRTKDPLELDVDLLPGFSGMPLRPAAELDGRVRCGVLPDPVQATHHQPYRLAVLAVVLEQRFLEPLLPGRLPPVPPDQALQARCLWIGPGRPHELPK